MFDHQGHVWVCREKHTYSTASQRMNWTPIHWLWSALSYVCVEASGSSNLALTFLFRYTAWLGFRWTSHMKIHFLIWLFFLFVAWFMLLFHTVDLSLLLTIIFHSPIGLFYRINLTSGLTFCLIHASSRVYWTWPFDWPTDRVPLSVAPIRPLSRYVLSLYCITVYNNSNVFCFAFVLCFWRNSLWFGRHPNSLNGEWIWNGLHFVWGVCNYSTPVNWFPKPQICNHIWTNTLN